MSQVVADVTKIPMFDKDGRLHMGKFKADGGNKVEPTAFQSNDTMRS